MKIVKKILFVLLIAAGVLVIIIAAALGIYGYNNMHYDENDMKKVWKAGFEEKQAQLPDGTVLNYAEGGTGAAPLFLIHGQGMAWEDYARVLPKLAEEYHVYAVDCHGHGSSSHNADDYSCVKMTGDFVWFIENVIGEPAVVSGHSSGGILAASIAASSPENVLGAVLEDPPFFSVLPEEMQNTFVWKDSFEVMHGFTQQTAEKYYVPYYFTNGYMWGMFQGLGEIPAAAAREYSEKNGRECSKIWYIPYRFTHGLIYMDEFDKAFAETFYNGTWLDGTTQEDILSGIECPVVYVKAKTSYGTDGVLYCANDDADAEKVMSLLKNGEMKVTETSDHDIHFTYADEFVQIMSEFAGD